MLVDLENSFLAGQHDPDGFSLARFYTRSGLLYLRLEAIHVAMVARAGRTTALRFAQDNQRRVPDTKHALLRFGMPCRSQTHHRRTAKFLQTTPER